MRFLISIAAVVLLGSCQGRPAPAPSDLTEAVPVVAAGVRAPTAAELARINSITARFKNGAVCDVTAGDDLHDLRTRLGTSAVRDALIVAFKACNARSALSDLLAETLPESPTDNQVIELGASYIRAARYGEAVEVLGPLAERQGAPSQTRWLSGFALLHAGDPDAALPHLIAGQAHAGGTGGSEALLLIGLAKLQRGEAEAAVPLLEQALAIEPGNVSALNVLTRALHAVGRTAEAQAAAKKTRALHAAAEERERVGSKLAALSTNLKLAWETQNFEDLERTIDRMWPQAPAGLRITLQEYRVEVFSRTGRPEEANAAREELARMRNAQ